MQGVIVSFDPSTDSGVIMCDTADRTQYAFGKAALTDSLFTMLRQGQRINFDVENDEVNNIRIGSEGDMGISTARV
jgi:hypothetical protein